MRQSVLQWQTSTGMPRQAGVLPAWTKAWSGVVAIAVLHGGLHRAYEPLLGELRAHQLSGVTLLLLLAPWVARTHRRHPLLTARAAAEGGSLGGLHCRVRVPGLPLRRRPVVGTAVP